MESKIKFRAWDKANKKTVYEDFPFSIITGNVALKLDPMMERNRYFIVDGDFEFQQFTGLLDKNNKEIYVGDVLRVGFFALNDIVRFGASPWDNLPHGVDQNDITTETDRLAVEWDFSVLEKIETYIGSNPDVIGVEIIGNVFDNPELLDSPQST